MFPFFLSVIQRIYFHFLPQCLYGKCKRLDETDYKVVHPCKGIKVYLTKFYRLSIQQERIRIEPNNASLTLIFMASLGPVVQSIVSLTTLLRRHFVKYMPTTLSNPLLFFVEKCKNLLQCKRFSHFFNKK